MAASLARSVSFLTCRLTPFTVSCLDCSTQNKPALRAACASPWSVVLTVGESSQALDTCNLPILHGVEKISCTHNTPPPGFEQIPAVARHSSWRTFSVRGYFLIKGLLGSYPPPTVRRTDPFHVVSLVASQLWGDPQCR